ncbi:vigilin [Nephila pilipes]|uniref:Vigilin n=1 Tax=Nephila pilipes TaxID=299642 RepID=A0A8X6Q863_NEPPI|nr:vigilin [Nephila pilipes]
MYHPFIIGPFNETITQIIGDTKARINIPPASVMKDEFTIDGEKEAVAKAKARIQNIYEKRKQNCQSISVEVPKHQHKYIIGPRGQTIQKVLQETGVSVEMPPPDVQSDSITLRGKQVKLGPALTLLYSKANCVKTEHMGDLSWLHKYVIGNKGANMKHMIQDLSKVQADFSDESFKVEGPPGEIYEDYKILKEMIDNLRKQVAYEVVKVNPAFHRHIIGKNGSNINRL